MSIFVAYTVAGPDCEDVSPFAFPLPFEDALPSLRRIGYDGVEMLLRQPSPSDARVIGDALARQDLRLAAVSTAPLVREDGLSLSAAEPVSRKTAIARVIEHLEFVAQVDPRAIVNIGRVRGAPMAGHEEVQLERLLDALEAVAVAAMRIGVTVVLEPQRSGDGGVLHTLREVADVTARLGPDPSAPTLGAMLDTYHLAAEADSPTAVIHQAGPLLRYMHLAGPAREPLAADQTIVRETLQALADEDYQGWVAMEHAQDPDGETAAAQSLRTATALLGSDAR